MRYAVTPCVLTAGSSTLCVLYSLLRYRIQNILSSFLFPTLKMHFEINKSSISLNVSLHWHPVIFSLVYLKASFLRL